MEPATGISATLSRTYENMEAVSMADAQAAEALKAEGNARFLGESPFRFACT
jgi:hypothetical protein